VQCNFRSILRTLHHSFFIPRGDGIFFDDYFVQNSILNASLPLAIFEAVRILLILQSGWGIFQQAHYNFAHGLKRGKREAEKPTLVDDDLSSIPF
jgi:hypothetical protein